MKKIIVANWKMNPKSSKDALALFEVVKKSVKGIKEIEVVICAPFAWLAKLSPGNLIRLGAQNCHWELQGAYTGEVAAPMLSDLGVEYVMLGHSERRKYMGETNEIINLKVKAALKSKLKPILCVGEREGEEMSVVIEEQLTQCLVGLSIRQIKDVVVVYEPVWAISTEGGRVCEPDNALSAALFIRKTLTKLYSRFVAEQILILYGGSVDNTNVACFISQARMNGALVGAASLDGEVFSKLIKNIPVA